MTGGGSVAEQEGAQPVEGEQIEDAQEGKYQLLSTDFYGSKEIQDESNLEAETYSYKEVSEISEVTRESYPEGYIVDQTGGAIEDLVDFDKLKEQT